VARPEHETITGRDLYLACRQRSGHKLNAAHAEAGAKLLMGRYYSAPRQMEQLHEICNYVKHYHKVYGDWGMDGSSVEAKA